tara:strand:+ start:286 stop:537 length:252 start_codon:yes stop_codon:yes gene_type:complete
VFFRIDDIGGSGATYYYFLAMRIDGRTDYSFALRFETSENGKVELTDQNTESGYSVVIVRDGPHQDEYIYLNDLAGYVENAVE